MKLNRLKSVAKAAVRDTIMGNKYLHNPFKYFTPEIEIEIDLINGTFNPDLEGDSVEEYYKEIIDWFHDVLPREGIPIDVIDNAIIKIVPTGGIKCIIKAQGRTFES